VDEAVCAALAAHIRHAHLSADAAAFATALATDAHAEVPESLLLVPSLGSRLKNWIFMTVRLSRAVCVCDLNADRLVDRHRHGV
jgi:hypothetical protein